MSSKRYDDSKQWYVIHTYSGYEEKLPNQLPTNHHMLIWLIRFLTLSCQRENRSNCTVSVKLLRLKFSRAMFGWDEISRRYIIRNTPGCRICGRWYYANSSFWKRNCKRRLRRNGRWRASIRLIRGWSCFNYRRSIQGVLMAPWAKLTHLRALWRLWSVCLVATLQSSLDACRLKV